MIEIIKRNEGHKSLKEVIDKGKGQISYNSDGRLVVRVIHDNDRDTLIVFDERVSNQIIRFMKDAQNIFDSRLPF